MIRCTVRIAAITLIAAVPALSAGAASPEPAQNWRVELRRQNTARGTPEETTSSTLRIERNLAGRVARLRLDLPFPDEQIDFDGSPFHPRLGDIKVRTVFRPFVAGAARLASDVEVTLPTADGRVKGSGKYQLSASIGSTVPIEDALWASGRHRLQLEWNVRQTLSVAGDADRKNISHTRPELALRDRLGGNYWLKLTLKPTIDWIQDGKSGAVLELEGGLDAGRGWRFSLMGGTHTWGQGVPGIYRRRAELVVGRSF